MIRLGLAYGWLSTRRRARSLALPMITTATGAFLLVQVMALTADVRRQAGQFGDSDEIVRATVLIAVVVLLVGVVEVAICTTRTVHRRTREIGVLGATGVRRRSVLAALLVEPLVAAVAGALAGSMLAVTTGVLVALSHLHSVPTSAPGTAIGALFAVLLSALAALVTSALPSWRAASQPPIHSLTSGG